MDLIVYIFMNTSHNFSILELTDLQHFRRHYRHFSLFFRALWEVWVQLWPGLDTLRPSSHSQLISEKPVKCRTLSILHISSSCKIYCSRMINHNLTSYWSEALFLLQSPWFLWYWFLCGFHSVKSCKKSSVGCEALSCLHTGLALHCGPSQCTQGPINKWLEIYIPKFQKNLAFPDTNTIFSPW